MGHGLFSESSFVSQGRSSLISADQISNSGADYIALGHVDNREGEGEEDFTCTTMTAKVAETAHSKSNTHQAETNNSHSENMYVEMETRYLACSFSVRLISAKRKYEMWRFAVVLCVGCLILNFYFAILLYSILHTYCILYTLM
jgi:hypothetical protein